MKKPLLAVSKLPTMNLDRIVNDFGDACLRSIRSDDPSKLFSLAWGLMVNLSF